MSDYLSFEGAVRRMTWGTSTYTVLPLPGNVTEALRAMGARRVEGEIAEHPINMALTTAPVIDETFLWTGKSLLKQIGITPGERVEVRLRPADPDAVEVPGDVSVALRGAGLTAAWDALSPGKRRAHLHTIETAKRPETRTNRLAKVIAALGEAL